MAKRKRRIPKKEVKRKSSAKRTAASRAATKGWETRRERALELAKRARRLERQRRARAKEKADKEASRLRKWRKSYAEYLKFRVSKKEREELAVPEKRELVCRVLFDADTMEDREEHFWTNVRQLLGDSIGNILARAPAEEGVVRATFRLIVGEDFKAMQAGGEEDVYDYGDFIELEWETELELEAFWSAYFEHARTLLPNKPEKQTTEYNAAALLVAKMQVCYFPGQISSDKE
jgi:hypothetical protein